jgi:hypothetical protein
MKKVLFALLIAGLASCSPSVQEAATTAVDSTATKVDTTKVVKVDSCKVVTCGADTTAK